FGESRCLFGGRRVVRALSLCGSVARGRRGRARVARLRARSLTGRRRRASLRVLGGRQLELLEEGARRAELQRGLEGDLRGFSFGRGRRGARNAETTLRARTVRARRDRRAGSGASRGRIRRAGSDAPRG